MICKNCGAVVTGNFCEYCGTKAEPENTPETAAKATPKVEPATDTAFKDVAKDPDSAKKSQNATAEPEKSSRKKSITLLLWLFLGVAGAHHFYNGRIGMGVLYICTAGLCGIGCIVDFVLILTGTYRDCDGRFLS